MAFSQPSKRSDHQKVIGLGPALAALLFFLWLAEEVLEGDTQALDGLCTLIHQYASPAWPR